MFAFLELGALISVVILLFLIPLTIAFMVFWIWMLVSAIQNKGISDGEKVAWVLAIVFLHFIGSVLYFFIGHPKRNAFMPAQPPVTT